MCIFEFYENIKIIAIGGLLLFMCRFVGIDECLEISNNKYNKKTKIKNEKYTYF
jgi:hypothetical protein